MKGNVDLSASRNVTPGASSSEEFTYGKFQAEVENWLATSEGKQSLRSGECWAVRMHQVISHQNEIHRGDSEFANKLWSRELQLAVHEILKIRHNLSKVTSQQKPNGKARVGQSSSHAERMCDFLLEQLKKTLPLKYHFLSYVDDEPEEETTPEDKIEKLSKLLIEVRVDRRADSKFPRVLLQLAQDTQLHIDKASWVLHEDRQQCVLTGKLRVGYVLRRREGLYYYGLGSTHDPVLVHLENYDEGVVYQNPDMDWNLLQINMAMFFNTLLSTALRGYRLAEKYGKLQEFLGVLCISWCCLERLSEGLQEFVDNLNACLDAYNAVNSSLLSVVSLLMVCGAIDNKSKNNELVTTVANALVLRFRGHTFNDEECRHSGGKLTVAYAQSILTNTYFEDHEDLSKWYEEKLRALAATPLKQSMSAGSMELLSLKDPTLSLRLLSGKYKQLESSKFFDELKACLAQLKQVYCSIDEMHKANEMQGEILFDGELIDQLNQERNRLYKEFVDLLTKARSTIITLGDGSLRFFNDADDCALDKVFEEVTSKDMDNLIKCWEEKLVETVGLALSSMLKKIREEFELDENSALKSKLLKLLINFSGFIGDHENAGLYSEFLIPRCEFIRDGDVDYMLQRITIVSKTVSFLNSIFYSKQVQDDKANFISNAVVQELIFMFFKAHEQSKIKDAVLCNNKLVYISRGWPEVVHKLNRQLTDNAINYSDFKESLNDDDEDPQEVPLRHAGSLEFERSRVFERLFKEKISSILGVNPMCFIVQRKVINGYDKFAEHVQEYMTQVDSKTESMLIEYFDTNLSKYTEDYPLYESHMKRLIQPKWHQTRADKILSMMKVLLFVDLEHPDEQFQFEGVDNDGPVRRILKARRRMYNIFGDAASSRALTNRPPQAPPAPQAQAAREMPHGGAAP